MVLGGVQCLAVIVGVFIVIDFALVGYMLVILATVVRHLPKAHVVVTSHRVNIYSRLPT